MMVLTTAFETALRSLNERGRFSRDFRAAKSSFSDPNTWPESFSTISFATGGFRPIFPTAAKPTSSNANTLPPNCLTREASTSRSVRSKIVASVMM